MDLAKEIQGLSPEKRALLEALLKQQGVDLKRSIILPRKRNSASYPTSYAQQRIWFLDQLEPGSTGYNIPNVVRVEGELDVGVFERSIQEIIRRHEVLRTKFTIVDEEPRQIIAPEMHIPVKVEDWSNHDRCRLEENLKKSAHEEALIPFDLAKGPLLRVRLIKLAENEHVVFLTMHHIIWDGWSNAVFLRELGALYTAYLHNKPSPLNELEIQYVDYAAWQRDYIQGETLESHIEYWKRTLAGIPPQIELPTDRSRPAFQSSRGAYFHFRYGKELSKRLERMSRLSGVTLFMTLLAGFQALLYRYCSQEDICIGTPVSNRNRVEIEPLIGFFVNTLVVRAQVSGNLSFRNLLEQVKATMVEAQEHQDAPFEMVVDALQPDRSLSRTPIFQVMFTFQAGKAEEWVFPGLRFKIMDVDPGISIFDLTFALGEDEEGIYGTVEYSTELFERDTIESLANAYRQILEAAEKDPGMTVEKLPLMGNEEREKIIYGWNQSQGLEPKVCVHDLFDLQARERPEAVALVLPCSAERERITLSYRELEERSNRLAQYLIKAGAGRGQKVGLCVGRSEEMVIGLLGILKSGSAYVPLDPAYPQERLRYMIQTASVGIVVVDGGEWKEFETNGIKIVGVIYEREKIQAMPSNAPENRSSVDDLAYVIFTSGSTGQPKGVMVKHGSLANHAVAMGELFQAGEKDQILQFSTINFDAALEEMFPVWLRGGSVVLRLEGPLLSAEELLRLAEEEGITILDLPTAYWQEVVSEMIMLRKCIPDCLRLVIVGGEKLQWEYLVKWQEFEGAERVVVLNTYGPTEATIVATSYRVTDEKWKNEQEIPIGRPIQNDKVYVLDRMLEPAAVGMTGELFLGGLGVAEGYINRPDLTEERFIPSLFENGERLYRTGDLVRWRRDGNLVFVGRKDEQVKIRGFRIELGEIESALLADPEIQQAACIVHEDGKGNKALVAYIEPAGQELNLEEVRNRLLKKLPVFMAPVIYIPVDSIPLTISGKVDRKALPIPSFEKAIRSTEFEAPKTPVEIRLAEIYSQLLHVENIGIYDNFFELGGHSLMAIQLISRIKASFNVEIPVREVFDHPDVAGLARDIEALLVEGSQEEEIFIPRADREDGLQLSYAQQRLWFLDQLEPGSTGYNIPSAVRVKGKLDVRVFEQCVNEIIRRHEILRTTFTAIEGEARQVIAPELHIAIESEDWSEKKSNKNEMDLRICASEEAQKPFDLVEGPLIRVRLIQLGKEEHVIFLTVHHIVWDGWSGDIFLHELSLLYRAYSNGQSSPLGELRIQYADYAAWQRSILQGEVLEKQLAYWKKVLAGIPSELELPFDHPRQALQTFNGGHLSFRLSPNLTKRIQELSNENETTVFMTLLSVFLVFLNRISGAEDIVVGTPAANRNQADLEEVIGFFVNTLALRANLSGEPIFMEVLQRVREVALGAYAHQDTPFEMVVEALNPERNLSHSPVFQVMFVLQNKMQTVEAMESLELSSIEVETGTAKFDLTLFVVEEEETLGGALEYNSDLFERATAQRMLDVFQTLLEGIVMQPKRPIWQFPVLSLEEIRQQVDLWNDTYYPIPWQRTVMDLFEEQVNLTPGDEAARDGQGAVTFQELNRKANRLARYLQKSGIGPEKLVGVCIPRSIDMLVALLSILKAGGAYVPLDPGYPVERLAYMIADAAAPALLTHSVIMEKLQPYLKTGVKVFCLDRDGQMFEGEEESNPIRETRPENLAYVIYTSGSTGRPKGVMIEQQGLVNYLTWTKLAYPLRSGKGAPVQSSISFDLTITSLFAPLLAGKRVLLLDEEQGAETLGEVLQEEGDFSLIKITPAHLKLLGEQIEAADAAGKTQAFIVGGENLKQEQIAFWRRYAPKTALVNEYGPTETVVGCCCYWAEGDAMESGIVPIGRPIINTHLYILDRHRQFVPVGVAGELYIGGVQVGRGYLNREELTAEKFLPDPFQKLAGARMYRTGDLARYRPDGNIECLGRIDFQVKIRGYRIELEEIETVLGGHSGVKENVLWTREENGIRRLIAYVVPRDLDNPPVLAELRDFLKERLPDYMVPAAFVVLPALPLNANGKVDRKALPAPELAEEGKSYSKPQNYIEQVLASIWKKALNVNRVGRDDNFFELGGDSILSIHVIAQANKAGLRLTPRQLFENPTISGLAGVIGKVRIIQAEQGRVSGETPLTPIQHWFLNQDLPEPHYYNQAVLLETPIGFNRMACEQAFQLLVQHHDALRTRFTKTDHGWLQETLPEYSGMILEWNNWAQKPDEEIRRMIKIETARMQAGLNLEKGILLTAGYFDLGESRPGRLFIAVHHLVMDGFSWNILLEDLITGYQACLEGEQTVFPPKTTAYQYWAKRLTHYANSEEALIEKPYWFALSHDEVSTLPSEEGCDGDLFGVTDTVHCNLSPEETSALLGPVLTKFHVGINAALLSALARSISKWTGNLKVRIDLEGHGREDLFEEVDISRTIGWFTSIYPVVLNLAENSNPGEVLHAVEDCLQNVPHRGFNYGILRYLSPDEPLQPVGKEIPSEIIFNYLGQVNEQEIQKSGFRFAAEERGPDQSPLNPCRYVLEINGGVYAGQLRIEWNYCSDRLKRPTVETLAGDFIAALRELIFLVETKTGETPDVQDFPLAKLSQARLNKLLSRVDKSKGEIRQ